MDKKVKGTLLLEYIRTIRGMKDVDFAKHLQESDLKLLEEHIMPSSWYPYDSYMRMGLAIVREVSQGNMEGIRLWSKLVVDRLMTTYRSIIRLGDPAETVQKFGGAFASFFNFPCVESEKLGPNQARVHVFCPTPLDGQEPSAYQILGSVERILEHAGAKEVSYTFEARQWQGEQRSSIVFSWK